MNTSVRSSEDLADDWLSTGSLQTAQARGQAKAYPKRSELRRAEARAANRRGADRRPAGGRPAGGAAGSVRPPAPSASGRATELSRRPHVQGFAPARLPLAVSPTPAVLPIRQTSSQSRPAGIDLPIPASVPGADAFHPPTPAGTPMVPIAIPAPPIAPPELAAPVAPSVDPALWGLDLDLDTAPETGRRRGAPEAEPARRSRRPQSEQTVPLTTRLLGKGRSGAARLLVLALVVGAEGVAVTSMGGTARTVTHDPAAANSAFEFSESKPPAALPAADLVASAPTAAAQAAATPGQPALLDPTDALAFEAAQQSSSKAMVSAALAQAKAAAARVQAAAARRSRAMRNAQKDPKGVAQLMVSDRGWSASQFSCLVSLWNRESMWNYQAYNAASGAYGIPQALPGDKMASAGADWRTNPVTQIRWGLSYIADRYGTPCGAWGHSQATGWY